MRYVQNPNRVVDAYDYLERVARISQKRFRHTDVLPDRRGQDPDEIIGTGYDFDVDTPVLNEDGELFDADGEPMLVGQARLRVVKLTAAHSGKLLLREQVRWHNGPEGDERNLHVSSAIYTMNREGAQMIEDRRQQGGRLSPIEATNYPDKLDADWIRVFPGEILWPLAGEGAYHEQAVSEVVSRADTLGVDLSMIAAGGVERAALFPDEIINVANTVARQLGHDVQPF